MRIPVLLLTLPLAAQVSPAQRSLDGLQKLRVGRWEDAFQEWGRESFLSPEALDGLQAACAKAAPLNRSLGHIAAFREPIHTDLWDRQYIVVTFDGPAVFFVFDWIWHRDMWRLQRLQVAQDPTPFLLQSIRPTEAR